MPANSTRVTDQHFEYIASHTTGEDAFLKSLKQAATAENIPEIWICPEQAALMQIILRAAG